VALPTDMVNLVRRAVIPATNASNSEVIREALREWKARRATRAEAIARLRKLWDDGVSSGPSDDLNIPALKQRGRQRLRSSRK